MLTSTGVQTLAHFGTFCPRRDSRRDRLGDRVAPFDIIEELFEVVVKYLEVRSLPPACFAPLPRPRPVATPDPPPLVFPFLSNPSPPA